MDNNKIYDFIKGNIINFIIILTSIGYIFYGQARIERTELTIAEVVAQASIGLIVGFMIKQSMAENGFNYGYRSQIWGEELDKYRLVCDKAIPYIEYTDNYYNYKRELKKKEYRVSQLRAHKMRYEWFFDKEGNYTNPTIKSARTKNKANTNAFYLERKQRKVLKKCINVKIYVLNLFSEYDNEILAYTKREKTDKDQRMKMFGKNGFAQLMTAIVGAYFIPVINGWSWASFVVATIQVCIWIACGVTQLYTNYNYVVIDKVNKLKEKKQNITEFICGCEKGLFKEAEYEKVLGTV